MARATTLTLRPFASERLVLVLVGVAALGFFHPANTQDKTRLALTHAIVEHGEVTIDRYGKPTDRARYHGRLYTDKAPGLSLLAVPVVASVRAAQRMAGAPQRLSWTSPAALWLERVAVVGPFLLLLTWLLGRVAEGLVPGTGAATAVTAALGTMLGALSSILFGHVVAASLCFAAFVVAARATTGRSAALAGALAGTAVLMEYQAALVVVLLSGYVLARRGFQATGLFAIGMLSAAAILGAYNTIAFGSPLRLSYSYIDGAFADRQADAFFGISAPRLGSLVMTIAGDRGLLIVSPVLAAAAVGLVAAWRRGLRAEVALAASLVVAFLALEAGYFLPYGGFSPGARFFAPALPFLLLGLPFAFAARPVLVSALCAVSIALSTANALTWPAFAPGVPFEPGLPETLWSLGDAPRLPGVVLACAATAAAALFALAHQRRSAARS